MIISSEIGSNVGYLGGSLVYLPILKNANTFFRNNFVENFGWTEIQFKDIDWKRHHVFAHIQDPIERRHKGVAEYLEMTNTTDLLENKRFQNFIRHVMALDAHSTPIYHYYGEYTWMIDWIPLDYGHERTIDLTSRLLESQGQRILKPWNMAHTHRSSAFKIDVVKKLKSLWEEKEIYPQYRSLLANDIFLYQQVKERFHQYGDRWDQISWLRDRYGNA